MVKIYALCESKNHILNFIFITAKRGLFKSYFIYFFKSSNKF